MQCSLPNPVPATSAQSAPTPVGADQVSDQLAVAASSLLEAFATVPEGRVSDAQDVRFGVREVGYEMHELNGWHGRRVLVNGRRVFCRGGYIQPELIFDWDARRMETELRYLSTHDILTGLYNRNFFETELRRFQESRFFPVSIIVIDLDHLKRVNDIYLILF